jgi:coenzyme F420-0:L-glutamate ligase/coenzyme F420-1:gamma-L-glutamate ligase
MVMVKNENRRLGLELIPVFVERKEGNFDFPHVIIDAVNSSGEELLDNDILAVSSKFISMAKGMLVDLSKVEVSEKAKRLAEKLRMDQRIAELVIREADDIIGGVPGFVLALKNGIIAPNAGIDKSNAPAGYAILYSKDPFGDADALRKTILQELGKQVGIVVTDSRLMPLRMGTTGLAIAVSGFEPLKDERGHKDLFGNILRVTRRALADQIAAGVQLLMGEADERCPVVIVRASNSAPWSLTDKPMDAGSMTVPPDQCIYMCGLPERSFTF